ncbi:hypothetical protein FHS42_001377 [Streptomyces zagrosensis]|uniref:Uncharacterized protein n=1 Tax=Streptomyces zagrosensis TaxID=1042984 RepID=A0A7W9UXI4_9ACTN|nr:hypothetical protein [Streptomyces zagrosensis]
MFRRRARDREIREAQRVGQAMLAVYAELPCSILPGRVAATAPPVPVGPAEGGLVAPPG